MDDEAKILILENNPTDAEMIEMQIRKLNIPYSAKRVATKEAFQSTMLEYFPDLVIADYALPRFDGLSALLAAKELTPGTPWIIINAQSSEETAVACMKAGAADYISKKSIIRLGSAVKGALDKKASQDQQERDVDLYRREPPESKKLDLFRRIVENAGDLVALLDNDGKRLYNNPAYLALLEDPETLEGTSSFVDVHPEDRDRVKRVFFETVKSGVGERMEYRLMDVDGNTRYIESNGGVIKDEDGYVDGVVVISRDITERKKHEDALLDLVAGTAGLTGEEFFSALVRLLASSTGVRYALVSECTDSRRERVRSLGYWVDDKLVPAFEYDVAGTTCEYVLKEAKLCYYPENVQGLFPEMTALVAMRAHSYLGVPLVGTGGGVLGHLFLMDDKPLIDPERLSSMLKIFATRSATELERMHQEEELHAAESHYRLMAENLAQGLIITDAKDIITFVNPRMEEISGYAARELIGRFAYAQLVPRDEWGEVRKKNQNRQRGKTERYETRMKRKNGEEFFVEIDAAPYRDHDGTIVGTIATVADIGGRHEEAEIRREQVALLDRLRESVVVADLEEKIAFWNAGAGLMYGWTADEAAGKKLEEVLAPPQTLQLSAAAEATRVEGSWSGEMRQRKKSGAEMMVESHWTLMTDSLGMPKSMLIVASDLTARKHVEMLSMRRQRASSIASLAGGFGKDLSKIVTPILMAAEELRALTPEEKQRSLIGFIEANARRGDLLARQVMGFAEGHSSRTMVLSSRDLLQEVEGRVREFLPTKMMINRKIAGDLWAVTGNAEQCTEMLTGICRSAIEAMPGGGELRFAAENTVVDETAARRARHARAGRYVVVTVGDGGAAIPSDMLERMLDPVEAGKEGGRGLALSTAAAIAQSNGGMMEIVSEADHGTTVRVYFPAVAAMTETSETETLPSGNGEVILVVDEDNSVRDMTRTTLETFGYDVITAADGTEAVALFLQNRDRIACVLTALRMQVMDGAAMMSVLQKMKSTARIIAAGSAEMLEAHALQSDQPVVTLEEPYPIERLVRTVAEALKR